MAPTISARETIAVRPQFSRWRFSPANKMNEDLGTRINRAPWQTHSQTAVSILRRAVCKATASTKATLQDVQQDLILEYDVDDKETRLLASAFELEDGKVEWPVPTHAAGLETEEEDWVGRGAIDDFLPAASCEWLIKASEVATRAMPPVSPSEFSLFLLGGGAEVVLGPAAYSAYGTLLKRIEDELTKLVFQDGQRQLKVAGAILYKLNAMDPSVDNQVHVCNAHVDKANKPEYDVSSILYLNSYGIDFTGGEFVFVDEEANLHIQPRAGRLVYFSSGAENLHKIQPVMSGSRWVMASWFTSVDGT